MPTLYHFRTFWGGWDDRVWPLESVFVMAPRPRLIRICVYLQNLKTVSAQIISKKCMQISPCIGKVYHIFKQNVPESESRQFDRLRLRLRLLARCQDTGRLRHRFRLRAPTQNNTAGQSPKQLINLPSGVFLRIT